MVMDTSIRLLEGLNWDIRNLGGLKRDNCQLTNLQVFQISLLLPFSAIKDFSQQQDAFRLLAGRQTAKSRAKYDISLIKADDYRKRMPTFAN